MKYLILVWKAVPALCIAQAGVVLLMLLLSNNGYADTTVKRAVAPVPVQTPAISFSGIREPLTVRTPTIELTGVRYPLLLKAQPVKLTGVRYPIVITTAKIEFTGK